MVTDTTRHPCGMLMSGEIKLKVSGREATAAGQQAIDALKTNNSFKQIGVALEMNARLTKHLSERQTV